MAKSKKTEVQSTLIAAAVAEVLGQGATNWTSSEHLAMFRYAVRDAIAQAEKDALAEKDPAKRVPIATAVNARLKAEFAKDEGDLAFASNMKKLLVESGDIQAGAEYA